MSTTPEPEVVVEDTVTPAPEAASPETTPKEDAPASPAPETPSEDVKPEEQLFETPDGRKVDAATLQKEWKDNFLPEFTRKSQRLAEYEKVSGKDISNPPADEPEWKRPDYTPNSYAEVIELATTEAINKIRGEAKAEEERVAAIQQEVDNQLSEIKKADPQLDENALFTHANKYGFRDLKSAYLNMADMKKVGAETEKRTVKNLNTREADPIAGAPGGEISEDSSYDPSGMSKFETASEYLAHVKGQK